MPDYDRLIEQTKATRIKKGEVRNPGALRKERRELITLAREHVPKAFARAREILDDDKAEWRAWIEAGKFITGYALGAPRNNPDPDLDEKPESPVTQLDAETLRALARQSLAEASPDESDDDDGTQH